MAGVIHAQFVDSNRTFAAKVSIRLISHRTIGVLHPEYFNLVVAAPSTFRLLSAYNMGRRN